MSRQPVGVDEGASAPCWAAPQGSCRTAAMSGEAAQRGRSSRTRWFRHSRMTDPCQPHPLFPRNGAMYEPPRRIQLSRHKGWRLPSNTVKVDRTTRFGNPFKVLPGDNGTWEVTEGRRQWPGRASKIEAQELSISLFREEIAGTASNSADRAVLYPSTSEIIEALRGRNLACWCGLGSPCHADVLLEIANGSAADEVKDRPVDRPGAD